jgi:hypothetical protein
VRVVVVDNAPALFALPCGDHACKDGGHDMTDAILRGLQSGTTHFDMEDTCTGSVGSSECGRVMRVTVTATYR